MLLQCCHSFISDGGHLIDGGYSTQSSMESFNVLPAEENVFVVQPISDLYLNWYRAAATAIIFQFTRINCGFGASETDLSGAATMDDMQTVKAALQVRPTPGHIIQVLFAEWLVVLVGLQSQRMATPIGSFHALDEVKGCTVVNNPGDLLTNVHNVLASLKTGTVLLSPVAVLAYLVDWFGAAQTWAANNSEQYKTMVAQIVKSFSVQAYTKGSPVHRLFHTGLGITTRRTVFDCLSKVLTPNAGGEPLPYVAIHQVRGIGPSATILLNAHQQYMQNVSHMIDIQQQDYEEEDTVTIPSCVELDKSNFHVLLEPASAIIVFTQQADTSTKPVVAHVLLHKEHEHAPFQYVAVNATVATVVSQLPEASAGKTLTSVWRLYPTASKQKIVDEIKRLQSKNKETVAAPPTVTGGQKIIHGAETTADQKVTHGAETTTPDATAAASTESEIEDGLLVNLVSPPNTPTPALNALTEFTMVDDLGSRICVYEKAKDDYEEISAPLLTGRRFTSGPNVIAIYMSAKQYKDEHTAKALRAIVLFLQKHAIVRNMDQNNYLQINGRVVKELIKTGAGAFAQVSVTHRPGTVTSITDGLAVSCVLHKEDLLWIAAHQDDSPRKILEALWNKHHIHDFAPRRFEDKSAAALVTQVIAGNLNHTGSWGNDPMVEMVFCVADTTAWNLVNDIETLMLDTTVCRVDEGRLYFGSRLPTFSCNKARQFTAVPSTDNLVLQKTLSKVDIVYPTAWSDWYIRGICFTTTQVALMCAVGTPAVKAALKKLLQVSVSNSFSSPFLQNIAAEDNAEIQKRLL